MYLLGLLSCALLIFVDGKVATNKAEDLPDVKWPVKYKLQAEKISLTIGLVEDIQYWRSKYKSRVDYNKGAVKTYSVKARLKSKFTFGVMYKVHPETTEEIENYLVCRRTNGTLYSRITLYDILPDGIDMFEYVGSEIFENGTIEKFSYVEKEDGSDIRQTLWAAYNRENKTWTPIRYEDISYDTWLDFKTKHEIWNFYNFATDFNSSDAFDVSSYECKDVKTEPDSLKLINSDINIISPENEDHVNHVFDSFKTKYNRIYANKEEHIIRRNLFQQRMKLVLENNHKNTRYKLAINKFADRTPEEMKGYMGLIRPNQREPDTHPFPYTKSEINELASNLPTDFDLRDLGVITPVKAQEDCGSCWTFGTTAAVEGVLARKNGGRLLRLSNQAVIDCSWGFGQRGCEGGFDTGAYRWMMEHGLPTEEEYGPYANKEGFCLVHNMTTIYSIRGYTNVTPLSVEALKVAIVNHGPLSVSIHATEALTLYNGGIFYDIVCDSNNLNHEVTLVGYGHRDGEDYWILKNSWGQSWGVDGYFYISVRDNNCGVTAEPTYPVL